MQNPQEVWQVEVGGQIYEAKFAELAEWIGEGSLQPGDKIRRGNLRWIEARKVPTLMSFFNAREKGLPMPVVVSTTDANEASVDSIPEIPASAVTVSSESNVTQPLQAETQTAAKHTLSILTEHFNPDLCQIHSDRESKYICISCGGAFCKDCPNAYGGVRICPACGQMCKPREEIQKQRQTSVQHETAMSGGFGFSDFGNAITYPFRFKLGLFFGAVMFMFFSLGQSAAWMGNIFLTASSIICFMLANMLTFGILANTVENFSQGKIGVNFMPDFEDFSIWDDVLHPFFLSIGVYISSFGAFALVFIVGIYLVYSSITAQMDAQHAQLQALPGTPYYSARDTVQQSNEVKKVLDDIERKNKERLKAQQDRVEKEAAIAEESGPSYESDDDFFASTRPSANSNTAANTQPVLHDTEEDVARADETINQMRKAQLESTIGKSPETQQKEYDQMIGGLLKLAAPLVVIGFLTLLWGLFYFPAACAVAGYTKSFVATINPLVGLDTIKRLGFDYVKILLMGFLIVIAFVVVGTFLNAVFFAFNMPSVGNVPAKAVGSFFSFYVWIVFCCVLGFALYKASDRLKLYR